ncbi:MAG: hypothetical protein ABEJ79_08540 [Halolamina sp.]
MQGDDAASDSEVMAAMDPVDDGTALVIADVSRDGAWLSVEAEQAPVLSEWC